GSAGLDVTTNTTINDSEVHVVPTAISGPLGYRFSALLLGRSSTTNQGITIIPGVIDADYTDNIWIILRVLCPPVAIMEGTKIAQLVPFKACIPAAEDIERGKGSFGSTDTTVVAFTQIITKEKPIRMVDVIGPDQRKLEERKMLLDTGSNITII
ncbi:POK9 protein, partial [Sitta europaea]|nr:POK9 protein [Sitta europaea]